MRLVHTNFDANLASSDLAGNLVAIRRPGLHCRFWELVTVECGMPVYRASVRAAKAPHRGQDIADGIVLGGS